MLPDGDIDGTLVRDGTQSFWVRRVRPVGDIFSDDEACRGEEPSVPSPEKSELSCNRSGVESSSKSDLVFAAILARDDTEDRLL